MVSSPFFTTKVFFESGRESGTPSLYGPPRMLCRVINPSIPVPDSDEGVGVVSPEQHN